MARAGHLYVVGFSNGMIKVGRSANPTIRLREHESTASSFGAVIKNIWVSAQHPNPDRTENALLLCVRDRAPSLSREWFTGIPFDDVAGIAKSVVGNPDVTQTPHVTTREMLSTRSLIRGRAHHTARRIWIVLWGLVDLRTGVATVSDRHLVLMTRSGMRTVQRGLALLRASHMITDHTAGGMRMCNLTPQWASAANIESEGPVFRLPTPLWVADIAARAEGVRKGPTLTLALALMACASMRGTGEVPVEPTMMLGVIAQLREMVGTGSTGSSFYRRLELLRSIGLVDHPHGTWSDGVLVNPVCR